MPHNGATQVYKTTDAGATWNAVGPDARFAESAPGRSHRPQHHCSYGYTLSFFQPADPGGIYRSTDGGLTFQATNVNVASGQFNFFKFAADPADPSLLFATAGAGPNTGGEIFESTNHGATWKVLTTGQTFNDFAVAGTAPNPTLYIANNTSGVIASTDLGSSFAPVNLATHPGEHPGHRPRKPRHALRRHPRPPQDDFRNHRRRRIRCQAHSRRQIVCLYHLPRKCGQ